MEQQRGRVLLVDDDAIVRIAYERALSGAGWTVETAVDGLEAKERVKAGAFDVIVSDVHMSGHGGLQFVRAVRDLGMDVPVVLMTGQPSIDSTISAIEHGVFRYLVKPVALQTLKEVVARAAGLSRMAALKRQALELAPPEPVVDGDLGALNGRFENAMKHLWVAAQPIVSWRHRHVFGYEALLRTDDSTLASPRDFLSAAERLQRLHEVGRAVRAKAAEAATLLPRQALLFVNLHAQDLCDEALFEPSSELARIAHLVVLEITERSTLDGVADVEGRVKRLKDLGFRIAVDNLGAGYAGLTSFTQLEPQIAKLDMSLIRGIDDDPRKQSIVRAMKSLCGELGILVVAEGVETVAERDMLAELGCDLLQGYLFARPGRAFPRPTW